MPKLIPVNSRFFPAVSTFLITLILAVGLLAGSAGATGIRIADAGRLIIETSEEQHSFAIELAATPSSRSRGLMHRREMAETAGMLFDFVNEQPVTMWMKNTYITLDMVFIDAAGRITNIARKTVPHSLLHIRSRSPVRAVLEINGGLASKLGIKAGDRVLHRIFTSDNKDR